MNWLSAKKGHSHENTHLLENLGFNPRAINTTMLRQAWETVDRALNDPALSSNFNQFARDYIARQPNAHTRAANQSGAIELLLTTTLVTLCIDPKAIIAPSEKTLIKDFKKVGKQLLEFEQATKNLDKSRRGTKAKPASYEDLKTKTAFFRSVNRQRLGTKLGHLRAIAHCGYSSHCPPLPTHCQSLRAKR